MATTYCTTTELDAIIGTPSRVSWSDDDQDGVLSVTEATYATLAIERAAVEMNAAIEQSDYDFADLASNAWCKWCNAYLAVHYLAARKNNTPADSVEMQVAQYRAWLEELRWGRFRIPEQAPSHETRGTVSTFAAELYKETNPIRVIVEESTGSAPVPPIKREVAGIPGSI